MSQAPTKSHSSRGVRMLKVVLVSTFPRADVLVNAVRALRAESSRIYNVYAPYTIHGLDGAMGIRRSRLPCVTAVAGSLSQAVNAFYTAISQELKIANDVIVFTASEFGRTLSPAATIMPGVAITSSSAAELLAAGFMAPSHCLHRADQAMPTHEAR